MGQSRVSLSPGKLPGDRIRIEGQETNSDVLSTKTGVDHSHARIACLVPRGEIPLEQLARWMGSDGAKLGGASCLQLITADPRLFPCLVSAYFRGWTQLIVS